MEADCPILRLLCAFDSPLVEDALLRAIDLSGPADQTALAQALIQRSGPAGLTGLVARYHELSHEVRAWLQDRAELLAEGLAAAGRATSRQLRLNAVELISAGYRPNLASLLATALSDTDKQIAQTASETLGRFVERCLASSSNPPAGYGRPDRCPVPDQPEHRQLLVAAVRTALATFREHQRLAVLQCAVWLADDFADMLRPMLQEPGHPVGQPLADQVGQSVRLGASTVPFLYLALSTPGFGRRFAARIAALRDGPTVIELIRQVWRADDSDTAKGLAAIRQMAFFSQLGWPERLPDELAGQTVRWIMALGASAEQKVSWLNELLQDGSPDQRSAAVEQLCRWRCEEAAEALRRAMDHPDEVVSAAAACEIIRRQDIDCDELMLNRLTHPNARVRKLACEQVGRTSFEKFWAQFPRLPQEQREFAAGKLKRVVADLAERLTDKLADPKPAQRLQAIRVADLCGLGERMGEALRNVCNDPNAKVRSAAIRLLGAAGGAESEDLAGAALEDPDRRVRANAVEALEAMRTSSAVEALTGMLDDPDNRIRANAIKALMAMDVATARDSLQRMLSDQSPQHRLSALWVVEQVGWFKPAAQVLRLAREDGDRQVRRRAVKALSELRRLYRTGRRAKPAGSRTAPAGRTEKSVS